jgi:hypothetical protein
MLDRDMSRSRRWLTVLGCVLLAATAESQFRGRRQPAAFERGNVPPWQLEPAFKRDCFTFARIKYRSTQDRSSYAWWTDYRTN